jgi:hypothetical protein
MADQDSPNSFRTGSPTVPDAPSPTLDLSAGMVPKQQPPQQNMDLASGMAPKPEALDLSAGMVPKPEQPEKPGFERFRTQFGIPSYQELKDQEAKRTLQDTLMDAGVKGSGVEPLVNTIKGLYGYGEKVVGDIKEAAGEVKDAAGNIIQGGPVGANIGKAAGAILKQQVRAVPFIGEPIYTAGEDLSQGNPAGAAWGLAGVVTQLVLGELGGHKGEASEAAAKAKIVESTAANLRQRYTDHETAQTQAAEQRKIADQTQAQHDLGESDPKNNIRIPKATVDEAHTRASAATANAEKSTEALQNAQEVHQQAAQSLAETLAAAKVKAESAKAGSNAKVQAKLREKNEKAMNARKEDLTSAFPSTRSAPYDPDTTIPVVSKYLEEAHSNKPLKTDQDVFNALDNAVTAADRKVKDAINVDRGGQRLADTPLSKDVMMDVNEALNVSGLSETGKQAYMKAGHAAVEDFKLGQDPTQWPTLGNAADIITELNKQINEAASKRETATPAYRAKVAAVKALREGMLDDAEANGLSGIGDIRSDMKHLYDFREAVRRTLEEEGGHGGEKIVRGTGQPGLFRKGVATGLQYGLPAIGSKFGYHGVIIGRYLGDMFAKGIAPSDLKVNQLVQRAMKEGRIAGEIPEAGAGRPDLSTRNGSPLHAELVSAGYGDTVRTTPYADAEANFLKHIKESYQDKGLRVGDNKLDPKLGGEDAKLWKMLQVQEAADMQAELKAAQDNPKEQQPIHGPTPFPTEAPPSVTLPDNYEAPRPIPGESGLSQKARMMHEFVHAYVKQKLLGDKVPTLGVFTELHPRSKSVGNSATVGFDFAKNYSNEEGGFDFLKLRKDLPGILGTMVSGGVANDLWHDMPWEDNNGLGGDAEVVKTLFTEINKAIKNAAKTEFETKLEAAQKAAGEERLKPGVRKGLEDARKAQLEKELITPEEQAAQIKAAREHVRELLDQPGVEEIFERHAEVREPGLNDTMHASAERLQQIHDDVENHIKGANDGNRLTSDGGSGSSGASNKADTGNTPGGSKPVPGDKGSAEQGLREDAEGNPKAKGEAPKAGNADEGDLNPALRLSVKERYKTQLPHDYEVEIDEGEGPKLETISGYSHRDAVENATKEFPKARSIAVSTRFPRDVADYQVPKGKLKKIPTLGGYTEQDVITHELGHVFSAHRGGLNSNEIISRSHPQSAKNAAATAVTEAGQLRGPHGYTRESIGPKGLDALLNLFAGGKAADELFNGHERKYVGGSRGDRAMTSQFLSKFGIPEEFHDAIWDKAIDDAKKGLDNPVTRGIIQENAPFREKELAPTHHYSTERLDAMKAEHDRRMQEYDRENGTTKGIRPDIGGVGGGVGEGREELAGRGQEVGPGSNTGQAEPAQPVPELNPALKLRPAGTEVDGEDVVQHLMKTAKENHNDAMGRTGTYGVGKYKVLDVPIGDGEGKVQAGDDYSPAQAQKYAKLSTPFPEIVLGPDGDVRDGNHRIAAAKIRGDKTIRAFVPNGYGLEEKIQNAKGENLNPALRLPDAQLRAHEQNGGSTFTPEGEDLNGKDLYAVGSYPGRTQVVNTITPEVLAKFKADNADVLNQPNHTVGTWKDPETGKSELDISKTYSNRSDAIAAGKAANQKAIRHLTGETIPTGGTGEQLHGAQVLDNLKQQHGVSNDARGVRSGASFITPEGQFIHLQGGMQHPEAIERAGGPAAINDTGSDTRPQFLNESGAIRTRFRDARGGESLSASVPPNGVTQAQVDALKRAVGQGLSRYGNLTMERADVAPENADRYSQSKEFPTPGHVDSMLRDMNVHPDQKTEILPRNSDPAAVSGFRAEFKKAMDDAMRQYEAAKTPEEATNLLKQIGRLQNMSNALEMGDELSSDSKYRTSADNKAIQDLIAKKQAEFNQSSALPPPNASAPAPNLNPALRLTPEAQKMLDKVKDDAYATYSLDDVKEGTPWLSEVDKKEGNAPEITDSSAGFLHPDGSISMIESAYKHDPFLAAHGDDFDTEEFRNKTGSASFDMFDENGHGNGMHPKILSATFGDKPTLEQVQSMAAMVKHLRANPRSEFQTVDVSWPGGNKIIDFATPGSVVRELSGDNLNLNPALRLPNADKVKENLSKNFEVSKEAPSKDNFSKLRFILSDGNYVSDPNDLEGRHYPVAAEGLGRKFTYEDADDMAEKGEKHVSDFMSHTGAVRIQPEFSDAVGVHVAARPSPQQLQAIAKIAKNKNVIFDIGDKNGEGSFGDFQRELDKAYPPNLNPALKLPKEEEDTSFNFGANRKPSEGSDRVSTRVPTAKAKGSFTPENHMGPEKLVIDRAAVDADPALQQKMADTVLQYPSIKIPKNITDPAKVLNIFTTHIKNNLLHLWDSVPEKTRQATRRWYDSVNAKANQDAEQYGIEPRQAAGVYAVLSPQKDWDMNADLARRVQDVHFNHGDEPGTPEMQKFGEDYIANARAGIDKLRARGEAKGLEPGVIERGIARRTENINKLEQVMKDIAGRKYNELNDYEAGIHTRFWDETHNPRNYPKIDPATGNPMGGVITDKGVQGKIAWGSFGPIANAVSILRDGSLENISDRLGGEHKVRNFYNNIIEPSHPGDVTVDTHAVGAGLFQPVSGKSIEVRHNLGNGGRSKKTGVRGTYPLFADAYRQAADERGVLPREMQSVTWEKIRELFPSEIKDKDFQTKARSVWRKYSDGKITADDARQQISQMAQERRANLEANKPTHALDLLREMRDNKAGQGNLFQGGAQGLNPAPPEAAAKALTPQFGGTQ